MIYAAETVELRSRFAPLPTGLHLGFCAFATVIFLLIYLRKKNLSSIIWMLICDATVILQFYGDSTTATAVGICEIILFAILAKVSFSEHMAARAEKKAAEAAKAAAETSEDSTESEPDERDDIAKLVKAERQKLNADGKDDIISNAFEDDKL